MHQTSKHIKKAQNILLMWFVLFSLSPCVVKSTLLGAVHLEYTKPLNQTKTPTSSCQFVQNAQQQILVVKQSKADKQTEPTEISENLFFAVRSSKIDGNYSKNSSGNSPPKYILYKRLKLDVA